MAGIYLHIPFCKQKCNYCNFFSLATTKFRDAFFQALLKEIELARNYLRDEPIETIYFGGGTPSLLPVSRLEEIIKKIRDAGYGIKNPGSPISNRESRIADPGSPEITLEMNPDDVTPEYVEALSQRSIKRVSLGVQSFFDEDLKYLSRSHDAKQAIRAVEMIRDTGSAIRDTGSGIWDRGSQIDSLSVDLIYGIPTLTNEHWKENLQRVIDLGIPHISAYALTVEPKTPLAWQIAQGTGQRANSEGHREQNRGSRIADRGSRITYHGSCIAHRASRIRHPVSDDQAAEQFEILMDMMEVQGYIQYEISNFCLPGYESQHNSNYWKGTPYLGLGPSAHSYNGTSRRWNISNLTSYIRDLASGILPFEEEVLTPVQRYNEYVMTSLRTIKGTDLLEIDRRFGPALKTNFSHQAIRHLASGHLSEQSGIFTLTKKGKFLSDGIAADLFVVG